MQSFILEGLSKSRVVWFLVSVETLSGDEISSEGMLSFPQIIAAECREGVELTLYVRDVSRKRILLADGKGPISAISKISTTSPVKVLACGSAKSKSTHLQKVPVRGSP